MSTYRDWHVGMKVVSLYGGKWIGDGEDTDGPERNSINTILGFDFTTDTTGIFLEEFPWSESFLASAFRPLDKRSTDISIFTAMLTDTKQKVDA